MKRLSLLFAVLVCGFGASAGLDDEVAQVSRDIVGKWTNINGPVGVSAFHQPKKDLDFGKEFNADAGHIIYIFRADGTYEEDLSEAAKQDKITLAPDEYVKAGGRYKVVKGEKYNVGLIEYQEYPFVATITAYETVRVYKRQGETILDFGLGNKYLQNRKLK